LIKVVGCLQLQLAGVLRLVIAAGIRRVAQCIHLVVAN
jgi:hypothetical protein